MNAAYRGFPDSVWEHPVRVVDPEGVRQVAATMQRLVESGFPSPEAATVAFDSYGSDQRPTELHSYLRQHLAAVAAFYVEAAKRQACVMVWWD